MFVSFNRCSTFYCTTEFMKLDARRIQVYKKMAIYIYIYSFILRNHRSIKNPQQQWWKARKVIKITNRSLDHLATTKHTSRATAHAPASPESGKDCRSRACCSTHMGNCCAKPPKDQRTWAATITHDDNHLSEENCGGRMDQKYDMVK
jgi:hypothetical protein